MFNHLVVIQVLLRRETSDCIKSTAMVYNMEHSISFSVSPRLANSMAETHLLVGASAMYLLKGCDISGAVPEPCSIILTVVTLVSTTVGSTSTSRHVRW